MCIRDRLWSHLIRGKHQDMTICQPEYWNMERKNLLYHWRICTIHVLQIDNGQTTRKGGNGRPSLRKRIHKIVGTIYWLVYRTDSIARGFWLVKQTLGWKTFMPKNFPEINRYFDLTSYCNTIGQSNNTFSILGLSLAGKRRSHVLIFSYTGC